MDKTKRVAYLGIGIALYVVLGCVMNIPILASTHLQTDLGYIAFGVYCVCFGWPAVVVGAIGCLIESLLVSGWIPYGWILGQIAIGLMCGNVYTKSKRAWLHVIVTVLAVFIGVALIKTIVECALFSIPFVVKFPKNTVAFVADLIPMLLGYFVGKRIKKFVK